MKRALKILVGVLVAAGIMAGAFYGFRSMQRAEEPPAQPEATGPVTVEVATVATGDVADVVWVTGTVEALAAVDVTPEISGRLERLALPGPDGSARDGAPLEAGVEIAADADGKLPVVVVIEHAKLDAAVAAAEAAVGVAAAAVESAKAGVGHAESRVEVARGGRDLAEVDLADARREHERFRELYEQGAATERQFDQRQTALDRALVAVARAEAQEAEARAALVQARQQVSRAQADLTQARARAHEARLRRDDATVRAPFAGVVARRFVDEGALVGNTTPLFRLLDIRRVEITGDVSGRHYARLRVGKTAATIEVDAYPGATFSGVISRLSPELNRASRTVATTITVPNGDGRLKPGMYARVQVVLRRHADVPVVDDRALVVTEDATRVYVVRDGRIDVREVKIGLEQETVNEVIEGLEAGEKVVVRGHRLLSDGMAVEVVGEDASP
ncbi:MAG: efflux RND transporter periplasmic adaptor subunit [Phycisphaerae bacterium]|nr:efflux RND transporter periplasmic adaptor subunit [Phycisphaerae bacterium]